MRQVTGHRYLYRRGGSYVFRRAVPERVRSAFGNRGEVLVSFGSVSLAEARHLAARQLARYDDQVAQLLGSQSPASVLNPPRREPSPQELEEAVREWFSARIERLQEEVDDVQTVDHARDRLENYAAYGSDASRSVRFGEDTTLTTNWIVEALIEQNGWAVGPKTPQHRRLIKLVSRGQIEVASRLRQELDGMPRETKDHIFSPEEYRLDEERKRRRASIAPISLLSLFDGYASERKPAPATVKAWRRQVRAFTAFLGHDDAHRVEAADVIRWKEHLLASVVEGGRGLSPKTVGETYLSAIKTTYRWAVDNEKASANPALKARVRSPRRALTREKGLTDAEAKLILRASLRPQSARLSKERALARRWVPWICAYTGARVNEITQLRGQDVVQIDGIWAIWITPEAGRIKTSVARVVALHPHLVDQGFPAIAAAKSGPLFFDPTRKRGGSDGNPQSKKVGEHLANWVRSIGVTDPNVQPNHGWRHRFKTQARRCRMNIEVRDRVQGHAPRTDGEDYGDILADVCLREISLLPRYEIEAE